MAKSLAGKEKAEDADPRICAMNAKQKVPSRAVRVSASLPKRPRHNLGFRK